MPDIINKPYPYVDTSLNQFLSRDGSWQTVATTPEPIDIADKMVYISYSHLVSLKDDAGLIPGQKYCILDYHTTTSQENTESAGHDFPIIVEATGIDTLSEHAKATIPYFYLWRKTENGGDIHGEDVGICGKSYMITTWLPDIEYIYPEDPAEFEPPVKKIFNYPAAYINVDNDNAISYAGNDPYVYDVFTEVRLINSNDASMFPDPDGITDDHDLQMRIYKTKYDEYCSGEYERVDEEEWYTYVGEMTFGDVDHFSTSNLDAWELKYCIYNDTNKYKWADENDGYGVIYYMKDEHGNECPYDFKNILFKRWAVLDVTSTKLSAAAIDNMAETFVYDANSQPIKYAYKNSNIAVNGTTLIVQTANFDMYYTFTWIDEDDGISDGTIYLNRIPDDEGCIQGCYNNKMEILSEYWADIEGEPTDTLSYYLNNNVFISDYVSTGGYPTGIYSNTLKDNSYNNTFTSSRQNTFGDNCYANTFGNSCTQNTFGNNCTQNTFGNGCYYNSFADNYQCNIFACNCYENTFSNNCVYNTLGNSCSNNTVGNYCTYNTFSDYCYANTFGNYCRYIVFNTSYIKYIIVESFNDHITLTTNQTTSYLQLLTNITIRQCTNNSTTTKTISHNTLNDTSLTTYQSPNSQTISI